MASPWGSSLLRQCIPPAPHAEGVIPSEKDRCHDAMNFTPLLFYRSRMPVLLPRAESMHIEIILNICIEVMMMD